MMKITTVYDNNHYHSQLIADWGFACVIEYSHHKIMFDTGANFKILNHNLQALKIDPKSITHLIISHKHWDHKGAAAWVLQQNPAMKVYMPKTFLNTLENKLKSITHNITSIESSFVINDSMDLILSKNWFINELVLAIKTREGVIIITGCSHTGIDNIVQKVAQELQEKIHCVLGGFHLLRVSQNRIKQISNYLLNQARVDFIAPCHCTGDMAMKQLQRDFYDKFKSNGVGAEHCFYSIK